MSWTLAVIKETDGTHTDVVIPSNWIKGEWVYWSNSIHATRDMEEQVPLKESWPKYLLKKRTLQSDDRKLCDEYSFSTTCDEDAPPKKKRSQVVLMNMFHKYQSLHYLHLFAAIFWLAYEDPLEI